MGLLARVFSMGDSSTYPYTYQAVVNILDEDDSIQVSYFADTICGGIEACQEINNYQQLCSEQIYAFLFI